MLVVVLVEDVVLVEVVDDVDVDVDVDVLELDVVVVVVGHAPRFVSVKPGRGGTTTDPVQAQI